MQISLPVFLFNVLINFTGILLCVAGSLALYDSSSDVIDITPSNFDKLVTNSDEVWIVEFYAPWCGHCKNLVPEYKKAAKALKVRVLYPKLLLLSY